MIYISGPISGTVDYLTRFDMAEDEIHDDKDLPYDDIINPADVLDRLPTYNLKYSDLMRLCLDLLSMCNSIYMLRGWEKSNGARLEHEFAITHNFKIYYQK